jgi:putative membrane protein
MLQRSIGMLKKRRPMTRMPQLLLSLAVSIVLVGCGRDESKTETEQVGTGTPTARDTVATRGTRDAGFLREQLAVGDKQVGLARLASERATRPAVRKFGEMMLRDYRQASEELRQIASRQQVDAGAENEQLKVERERLSRLSGEQFEREYLDEIVADHQDAVGDLENAAKGNDPEIAQWAARNLPIVRRHLDEAQQLRKTAPQKDNPPQ